MLTHGEFGSPGSRLFGAFGRWLFRVRFLDSEYAAMMKDVLQGYKEDAEERKANSHQDITVFSRSDQALRDCIARKFCNAAHAEFIHQAIAMKLDGLRRYAQRRGNFLG